MYYEFQKNSIEAAVTVGLTDGSRKKEDHGLAG